jgi:transposase
MEKTGIYNNHVITALHTLKAFIWVEKAIHIKRSSGLQRGKSDKVDAQRIGLFAYRHQDQAKLWSPTRVIIQQLKSLTTVRDRLLLTVSRLKTPLNESKKFDSKEVYAIIKSSCSKSIKAVKEDLKAVENRIKELIKQDSSLHHLFTLVTSVAGIGPVIGREIIITTNEFKDITEAKKYACYAGVAPFAHSSGTSIKGKNKVSHFANKNVKKLLHLGAVSLIRHKGEIREYWLRKLDQGKQEMVVLNAIRNKLIQRVFAVVARGTKYEKNYRNNLI